MTEFLRYCAIYSPAIADLGGLSTRELMINIVCVQGTREKWYMVPDVTVNQFLSFQWNWAKLYADPMLLRQSDLSLKGMVHWAVVWWRLNSYVYMGLTL